MQARMLEESDRDKLAALIEKDPYHKEKTSVDFWYSEGTKCLVYEEGDAAFFLKVTPSGRIDIQFDAAKRLFNAKTLTRGFPAFCKVLKEQGYKELSFELDSPELQRFCVERLGAVEHKEYRIQL